MDSCGTDWDEQLWKTAKTLVSWNTEALIPVIEFVVVIKKLLLLHGDVTCLILEIIYNIWKVFPQYYVLH